MDIKYLIKETVDEIVNEEIKKKTKLIIQEIIRSDNGFFWSILYKDIQAEIIKTTKQTINILLEK